MCGIFGIINKKENDLTTNTLMQISNVLFKLSESRGKEASGVAVFNNTSIKIYKEPLCASQFIKTKNYRNIFLDNNITAIIGHTRLATDGNIENNYNNQPVIKNAIIGIHNGIIVNAEKIWHDFPSLIKEKDVDTEVLLSLINHFINNGDSLTLATQKTFQIIEGTASIICLFKNQNYLLAATNNGSLYFYQNPERNICLFASELSILTSTIRQKLWQLDLKIYDIQQIKPNSGLIINLSDLSANHFPIFYSTIDTPLNDHPLNLDIIDLSPTYQIQNLKKENIFVNKDEIKKIVSEAYQKNSDKINQLKRCSRCILPSTIPFINFDDQGVCNYCRNYEKIKIKNNNNLREIVTPYHQKNKYDCLVMFSGGRDSSYGLHYIKNELNMNPIAYSYDWGMLTDLGRRNQARMCGKLGVEHILISADIRKKRGNIKKNIEAWLKKPNLGTVPLFMAGDKQFFYYANQLKKQMDIDLIFFCINPLEKTGFKTGFSNINPFTNENEKGFYRLSSFNSMKLIFYYFNQYLKNPAMINSSLLDTAFAYISYYLIPHHYINLYEFIKWDEKIIDKTLINQYNWELANDTKTTWRIGDGSAAFYNYIYYTVAGLTENDTFRSNQIREGAINRTTALSLILDENKPRIESLEWYGKTVNIDLKKTIEIINKISKLY